MRSRSLPGLLLSALVVASFACGCRQQVEEETPQAKASIPALSRKVIADDESFGFKVRLGEPYDPVRLSEQLAGSRFPVQVAKEDANERMVPGTAGDGTIYFWIMPDPGKPDQVGALTIGADLKTANSVGMISQDEYAKLVEEARRMARESPASELDLARYVAAEAQLASRRNPDIATAAGVRVGSTRREVIQAYGEPEDTVYLYGDTVLVYRGKRVALALRLASDVVRTAMLFPAEYDYLEFRRASEEVFIAPEDEGEEGRE